MHTKFQDLLLSNYHRDWENFQYKYNMQLIGQHSRLGTAIRAGFPLSSHSGGFLLSGKCTGSILCLLPRKQIIASARLKHNYCIRMWNTNMHVGLYCMHACIHIMYTPNNSTQTLAIPCLEIKRVIIIWVWVSFSYKGTYLELYQG